MLCEEYEDADAIRSFTIRGVCQDEDLLKEEMQRLIREDPDGAVSEKGVDESELRPTHFMTNYSDRYLEYYILEEPVQTRSKDMNLDAPAKGKGGENEKTSLSSLISEAEARTPQNKRVPEKEGPEL